jgi:hypothetical protein
MSLVRLCGLVDQAYLAHRLDLHVEGVARYVPEADAVAEYVLLLQPVMSLD